MKDGLLGPGDLQMIWYFIRREVSPLIISPPPPLELGQVSSVYIYTHTLYIHILTCMYIHIHIHIHVYISIHAYISIHTCLHTHTTVSGR